MSNAYRSWKRTAAGGLLLAGCLLATPAFSQEIIKWVDKDGVTHFGHAATAARQAMQEHLHDEIEAPKATPATPTTPATPATGEASRKLDEPATTSEKVAAVSPRRL